MSGMMPSGMSAMMETAAVKEMMEKAMETYKEEDFAAEKEAMAQAVANIPKPAACSDADFQKAKDAVQEMFKPEIMKKSMEAAMMEGMMDEHHEGEHHDEDGHDHGSGSGMHEPKPEGEHHDEDGHDHGSGSGKPEGGSGSGRPNDDSRPTASGGNRGMDDGTPSTITATANNAAPAQTTTSGAASIVLSLSAIFMSAVALLC